MNNNSKTPSTGMRNFVSGCLGPSEIIDSDDDNSDLGDIQAPLFVATSVLSTYVLLTPESRRRCATLPSKCASRST